MKMKLKGVMKTKVYFMMALYCIYHNGGMFLDKNKRGAAMIEKALHETAEEMHTTYENVCAMVPVKERYEILMSI